MVLALYQTSVSERDCEEGGVGDDEWVSILVPRSRVREFYQRILEQPPAATVHVYATGPAPRQDSDTAGTVRLVYLESPAPLQRFFELLASRLDEWVSTDDVMKATGLTSRQWPQQLSALARRGKTRYKRQRGAWPFQGEKTYESGKQTWRYRMPGEYAEIIRSTQREFARKES